MPKCLLGHMIEHYYHRLLSMPLNSRTAYEVINAIEDQDADYVFKFISYKNFDSSEFYLVAGWVTKKHI
jgi:hypothetical protein